MLRYLTYALLSLLVVTAIGCKSSEVADGTTLKRRSAKKVWSAVQDRQQPIEWLESKAKVKFTAADESERVTAFIRMQRDTQVWMVFKKLSVEGARMKVTPDSVYLLNRLDKQYAVESLSFLRDRLGLPADFQDLQRALVGQLITPVLDEKMRIDLREDRYVLTTESDAIRATYEVDSKYRLRKMKFFEVNTSQEVAFHYSDYEVVKGGTAAFPMELRIDAYHPRRGAATVEIAYSKVTLNEPTRMRFSIPDHYERAERVDPVQ